MHPMVLHSRQVAPARPLQVGGHALAGNLSRGAEAHLHGLGLVEPFGTGQKDQVRLLGQHVFGAERPPVADLPIGDVVATQAGDQCAPHAVAVGVAHFGGALLGQLEIDLFLRGTGFLDAGVDVLEGLAVVVGQLLGAFFLAHDLAQRKRRGHVFVHGLRKVIEHQHGNAGSLDLLDALAQGLVAESGKNQQVRLGGDEFLDGEGVVIGRAHVRQGFQFGQRLFIGGKLFRAPVFPGGQRQAHHAVQRTGTGDGQIIFVIKAQHHTLGYVGNRDLATHHVGGGDFCLGGKGQGQQAQRQGGSEFLHGGPLVYEMI